MSVICKPTQPLTPYEDPIHSQSGEDGVVKELLRRIDHANYVIDIGAWDGVFLSNCLAFLEMGWAGLLVEGDPHRAEEATKNMDCFPDVQVACEWIDPVSQPLSRLLIRYGVPNRPSLLSIDIDGHDVSVWSSIGVFRPDVVVIEFNPTIPNHVSYVQPLDAKRVGNSARAILEMGELLEYSLAHAVGVNLILVSNERIHEMHVDILNIHDALDDERTFRGAFVGYDGSTHSVGYPALEFLWHGFRKPIHVPRLPSPFRMYPDDLPRVRKKALAAYRQYRRFVYALGRFGRN